MTNKLYIAVKARDNYFYGNCTPFAITQFSPADLEFFSRYRDLVRKSEAYSICLSRKQFIYITNYAPANDFSRLITKRINKRPNLPYTLLTKQEFEELNLLSKFPDEQNFVNIYENGLIGGTSHSEKIDTACTVKFDPFNLIK
jgi:hypothetical protein